MEEDMKLNPEYTFSRNSSYICRSITRGRRGLLKTFHYLTWLNHNTESYSTRCKCFPFHLSIINNVYIILLNRKSCIYQYINVDIDTFYIMKFIVVQLAFRTGKYGVMNSSVRYNQTSINLRVYKANRCINKYKGRDKLFTRSTRNDA